MTSQPHLGAADLHVHSSVSDGTVAPATLLHEARDAGLTAISLTDHDTTRGWATAATAVDATGVALIPGMELSTREGHSSVHLLAYLVDPDDEALVTETTRIRESRLTRAEDIVRRIARDYPITWNDVLAHTGEGTTIGRPHIADALVARGLVATRTAAFGGILHPRAGYSRPHYAPDALTGVRLIRAAGGVPVLAHPGTRGTEFSVPAERLAQLADAGLFGLEIDHPENLPESKPRLHALARRFNLAVTGSSDYHGAGKTNRLGECVTSSDVVARIVEHATGSSPIVPRNSISGTSQRD